MLGENWVAIEGYVGRYAVSDLGNVLAMDFKGTGLPGLMKPSSKTRYQQVCIGRKTLKIHRLVAAAFLGPRPAGAQINHKDGNRNNNSSANLEYCTPSENQKHAFKLGLKTSVGESHSQARLNDDIVRSIRALRASGLTRQSIARQFGVSLGCIDGVIHRRRWSHVKDEVIQ